MNGLARDEVPFLHVRVGSPAAGHYRRMGFETRRETWVLWRKPIQGPECRGSLLLGTSDD